MPRARSSRSFNGSERTAAYSDRAFNWGAFGE